MDNHSPNCTALLGQSTGLSSVSIFTPHFLPSSYWPGGGRSTVRHARRKIFTTLLMNPIASPIQAIQAPVSLHVITRRLKSVSQPLFRSRRCFNIVAQFLTLPVGGFSHAIMPSSDIFYLVSIYILQLSDGALVTPWHVSDTGNSLPFGFFQPPPPADAEHTHGVLFAPPLSISLRLPLPSWALANIPLTPTILLNIDR